MGVSMAVHSPSACIINWELEGRRPHMHAYYVKQSLQRALRAHERIYDG